MELQLILSKPKEMLKRKESEEDQVALEELEKLLTQPETPQGSGLASLVASAVKKNELNNEDKTLEEHRRQSQVPSTPTGRGDQARRYDTAGSGLIMGPTEAEKTERYNDHQGKIPLRDPYMSSPSMAAHNSRQRRPPSVQKPESRTQK